MDPLTLASAFATIVHLLGVYAQEHKDVKGLDHQKFVEWLQCHKHEQLVTLICNTAAIQSEVDKLLRQDHALMMVKLDAIDTTLASLLSRVEGFGGLASVMVPSAQLSEQAVSILRQFVKSESKWFQRIMMRPGPVYYLENGGQIEYTEPRFIDDDLDKLVSLSLLSLRQNTKGEPIYGVTREAVRLIGMIDMPTKIQQGRSQETPCPN